MTLKYAAIDGYDLASVWAKVLGRDEANDRLERALDDEEACHERLMELARDEPPRRASRGRTAPAA